MKDRLWWLGSARKPAFKVKSNRSTIFATPFDMLKKVGLEFPWFRKLSNAQRKSVLIHLSFCTRSICIEKPLAVCVYWVSTPLKFTLEQTVPDFLLIFTFCSHSHPPKKNQRSLEFNHSAGESIPFLTSAHPSKLEHLHGYWKWSELKRVRIHPPEGCNIQHIQPAEKENHLKKVNW